MCYLSKKKWFQISFVYWNTPVDVTTSPFWVVFLWTVFQYCQTLYQSYIAFIFVWCHHRLSADGTCWINVWCNGWLLQRSSDVFHSNYRMQLYEPPPGQPANAFPVPIYNVLNRVLPLKCHDGCRHGQFDYLLTPKQRKPQSSTLSAFWSRNLRPSSGLHS